MGLRKEFFRFFWILLSYLWLPSEWYRKLLHLDWQQKITAGKTNYQELAFEAHRYSLIIGSINYFNPMGKSILDMGCGSGILYKRLSYPHYVGVDINEQAIDEAKKNVKPGAMFICASADNFIQQDKFDVIIFNESLYYMKEPLKVLQHFRSNLNLNGIFIICQFRTSIARKIWQAIAKTDLQELSSVEIINERGDTSILKILREPGLGR